MSQNSDWMPARRTDILEMGRVWIEYLTSARRTAWGVPQDQYNELAALFDTAQELLHYRFTRRKKEKIVFEAEDAGMTVYICCRYENQKGEAGDWGPVTSIVVPG